MPAGGPGMGRVGGLTGVTWPEGPDPDGFLLVYTKHLMSPSLAAVGGQPLTVG